MFLNFFDNWNLEALRCGGKVDRRVSCFQGRKNAFLIWAEFWWGQGYTIFGRQNIRKQKVTKDTSMPKINEDQISSIFQIQFVAKFLFSLLSSGQITLWRKKVWLVQPTSFIIIHYASLRSLEMQYMPLITFDNLAQKNVSWLTSFRLTKTKIILFQRDERETDFVDLDEEEVLSHLSWSFSFDK